MELFLDTANLEEIKSLNEILTIKGVTTNPTIIAKGGLTFSEVIEGILAILSDEQLLFIQAVATTCEGIVEEAKTIHSLRSKNMYVKIPVTQEGLKAIKKCKELGYNVLATAIYTANQGFLAALSGADYLAPYVNRMDNYGDGIQNTLDLVSMINVNQMNTKVIAASFKNTKQVHTLIKGGIHAITLPIDVTKNMIHHPATTSAVDTFTSDWTQAYQSKKLVK